MSARCSNALEYLQLTYNPLMSASSASQVAGNSLNEREFDLKTFASFASMWVRLGPLVAFRKDKWKEVEMR